MINAPRWLWAVIAAILVLVLFFLIGGEVDVSL